MSILEKVRIGRMMGKKITLPNGEEAVANVVAVLQNVETGKKRYFLGANIVTNDGDTYYAQEGAGEATDDSIAGMRLGTDNTAATKSDTDVTSFLAGSGKAIDGTYPMTDDSDGDNTGAAVDSVTWRVSYTTSEANGAGIYEGAIVDNISSPTMALTHWVFGASFTKTSSDTLKVFVNHNFLGV